MNGAFLTLLNEHGKILFFVAGALRWRASKSRDELVHLMPLALFKGLIGFQAESGPYQPEYEVQAVEGQDRFREAPIRFNEIPALSRYLAMNIPHAVKWGILRVGPEPGNKFVAGRPNGTNAEFYLCDRSWRKDEAHGVPPGIGSFDMGSRLAPDALELAQSFPSAWSLAMVSAHLFGGMSKIPTVTPIQPSAIITDLVDMEVDTRRKRKVDMELARAHRAAQQRADREIEHNLNPLREAMKDSQSA